MTVDIFLLRLLLTTGVLPYRMA